jgi:hypothetical protein
MGMINRQDAHRFGRTSRSEDVAAGELPHAGDKLSQPAGKDGHPYDDVGGRNSARFHVVN